jgi:type IV secretory pathway VirB4 component
MKLIFTLFLSIAVSSLLAQDSDALKKEKINYLTKQLEVSESKAKIISEIMDDYKASVNKVINDNTLTSLQVSARIEELQDKKNKQLSPLLTEEQLLKIVPTTERENKK